MASMGKEIKTREVVTKHTIIEIADDLSSMTTVHNEAVPEQPARRARRRRRVGRAFVMVDQISLAELDLSRQEYRVFSTMLSLIDKETGEIRATNTLIGERSGMDASSVSHALRSLRERKIVSKEMYGVWRINPWIAYVGEWKEWDPAAARTEEPVWSTH